MYFKTATGFRRGCHILTSLFMFRHRRSNTKYFRRYSERRRRTAEWVVAMWPRLHRWFRVLGRICETCEMHSTSLKFKALLQDRTPSVLNWIQEGEKPATMAERIRLWRLDLEVASWIFPRPVNFPTWLTSVGSGALPKNVISLINEVKNINDCWSVHLPRQPLV